MKTLAEHFRIGISTFYKVIAKTCIAINEVVTKKFVCIPDQEGFASIAHDFYKKWNLPNCCGACDIKQFEIVAPPKSGSFFFNYKKFFSIGVLAISDAHMRFTCASVGIYGINVYMWMKV